MYIEPSYPYRTLCNPVEPQRVVIPTVYRETVTIFRSKDLLEEMEKSDDEEIKALAKKKRKEDREKRIEKLEKEIADLKKD